jgi:hypothetical protein
VHRSPDAVRKLRFYPSWQYRNSSILVQLHCCRYGGTTTVPARAKLGHSAPSLLHHHQLPLRTRVMPSEPAATALMTYTNADWDKEYLAIFSSRTAPPLCPGCGRSGFYGPRQAGDRRYRLCKFCGFYEAVDAEVIQCRATVHGCPSWPRVAGAAYVWWVHPQETEYRCPYCGTMVEVATVRTKRPAEDASHPWWQVPQNLSFEEATAFWFQHGEPRVYL